MMKLLLASLIGILLLAAATTFDEAYRAGLMALQQNHLMEARTNLENAARLQEGDARVWLALAQTYRKLQEPAKANDAAEKAARLASGDPRILHLLGVFYAESGQPDAAVTEFQAALRLSPYEESYAFDLANLLLQQQRFEAAIAVLVDARRKFNKSAQLELALGVGYYGLRRYEEAATAFRRTIALSPEVEQAYVFLGKMLDQIPADVPELTRLFENYEKAHPQSYVGYLLHAKGLLAQSLDTERAVGLLQRSSALNEKAAEPHFELGVRWQRQRKFAGAAAEFERAAALDPSDAPTHYHLAQVYDRLGKQDAATAEREQHARLMGTGRQ
jgi:tetratricopeptide (TPR) repeat protein